MGTEALQLFLSVIFAFLLVYFLVPLLVKVAYRKKLYDKPDGERKIHDRFVPSLGGIALFGAIFLGFSVSGYAEMLSGYSYIAAALTMLFFTGLKDDLMGLSPVKKLMVEVSAALLVIYGGGFLIDNLYGVFGIGALPVWVAVPLTVFTFIVVMNSFNLIDGIDGLAAGVGILACFFFGVIFWISGVLEMMALALVTAVALSAFLVHNFRPASIFMGDSGSLVIGFLLAILAVNFIGLGSNSTYVSYFGNSSPVLPAIFLVIPLFDTLRVFTKRVITRRSPFSPGIDHIHHVLLGCGLSHAGASIYLYTAMTIITLVSLLFIRVDPHLVLLSGIATTLILLPTNNIKRTVLNRAGMPIETVDLVPKNPSSSAEPVRDAKPAPKSNIKETENVKEAVH